MTGIQLATRAGIDQSFLSKLESGKIGFTVERLNRVLAALGTTPSAFYGTDNVSEIRLAEGKRIPVLDYVRAGEPASIAASFGPDDILNWVTVDYPGAAENDLFGLLIKGESMEPEFLEGDCVIFQRSLAPQPGDYVVAVTGAGEAVFKRYKVLKTNGQGQTVFALVPTNDDFPTLRSDELPLLVRATMIEHRKYRRR